MSIYARFKRSAEGFRKLVELLESTPLSRRKKLIDAGMEEDAEYTEKAMEFVMNFRDILGLPDMELAELCAKASPRMLGCALNGEPEEVQTRFLNCSKPVVAVQIREHFETKLGPSEIEGARLKVIESARALEREGHVSVKKIPLVNSPRRAG